MASSYAGKKLSTIEEAMVDLAAEISRKTNNRLNKVSVEYSL